MKFLSVILFISIVTITVLGFVGFSDNSHSAFMMCVRNFMAEFCDVAGLGMGINHANVFASFSLAVLLLAIMITVSLLRFFMPIIFSQLRVVLLGYKLKLYSFNFKKQLVFWLGLFEKKEQNLFS